MSTLRTNGMGPGSKVHQCQECDRETKGRPTHLIFVDGKPLWVCDGCYGGKR